MQHRGCWNSLEKLAEIFLNTIHQDKIFENMTRYKVLAKNASKNIQRELNSKQKYHYMYSLTLCLL